MSESCLLMNGCVEVQIKRDDNMETHEHGNQFVQGTRLPNFYVQVEALQNQDLFIYIYIYHYEVA